MSIEFDWDTAKARSNLQKHGVSFEEAESVFRDPVARLLEDPDHSTDETREIIMGYSSKHRCLVVSFTERGGRMRIISARAATKKERRNYEESIQSQA